MAILKDVTRVHYQGPLEFFIVCKLVRIVLTWLVDLQRKISCSSYNDGLPFKNSFELILTPTPHMFGIGRKLLISRAHKAQHA
jgi:hypothetical protein